VLVGVDGLEVASRTSAFSFKGSDADIPTIAAELNVRHVVEGSVRRAGDTIRVTAQLIDGSNDRHLWSNTFDRDLSTQSIFEIQDEIASAIVAALSAELGTLLPDVEVLAATENLTAYELFLQARPIFLERGDLEEADRYLAQAVALDPEFAEAWEMRAASNFLLALGATAGGSDETLFDQNGRNRRELAIEFASQALALDPNSSLAITVNTFLNYPTFPAMSEEPIRAATVRMALDGYTRALEIDPHNATALNWRGIVRRYVGHLEEAAADFARCIELEPQYAPCNVNNVFIIASLGDDEAAQAALIRAWELGQTFVAPYGVMARMEMRGAFMLQAAGEFGTDAPWGNHSVFYEMYRNPDGDFAHLIPAIAEWATDTDNWSSVSISPDVMIGNYDGVSNAAFLIWGPEHAGWRASEGFQNFLAETPLPEFWRAYGFPPRCHERDDGWIECD